MLNVDPPMVVKYFDDAYDIYFKRPSSFTPDVQCWSCEMLVPFSRSPQSGRSSPNIAKKVIKRL
jgi:hypothetical protein